MKKLRYFCHRVRPKTSKSPSFNDYYFIIPKELALKYNVPPTVSLGRNYAKAVKKWQELNAQIEHYKNTVGENRLLYQGSFLHMCDMYYADRRFKRLAQTTKNEYKRMLNHIANTILIDGQKRPLKYMHISSMNREFCIGFYEGLLAKGVRTAEAYIKILINVLNIALDFGYIEGVNPANKLRIEKNPPRTEAWHDWEFKRFCKKAAERGYTGLVVAMYLGMYTAQRRGDILNLKWSDITDDFSKITIQQSKTKKTDKEIPPVKIPLNQIPPLYKLLKRVKKVSEYIVVDHTDNEPYCNRARLFHSRFEKIRKASKIREKVCFRDLRRTLILKLDTASSTEAEISAISGHSRKTVIDMLETYAPKTLEKATNAYKKLHLYDKRKKQEVERDGKKKLNEKLCYAVNKLGNFALGADLHWCTREDSNP